MLLFLRALCALPLAVALLAVPAAAATYVVYEEVGASDTELSFDLPLPGSGRYEAYVLLSAPMSMSLGMLYTDHWDTFLAPAPRPHSEFLEGNSGDWGDGISTYGKSAKWTFVIPETTRDYFSPPAWYYEAFNLPDDAIVYKERRAESPYFQLYTSNGPANGFAYYLRISAVPEPQVWAMLIVGFGLAGAALRTGRRRFETI